MKLDSGKIVVGLAVLVGGIYIVNQLMKQNQATPGVTPATGAGLPPPGSAVQQSLDTALTNIATGVNLIAA